ncbi:MAG: hypothetical protein JW941_05125 [Candidatus Coatesbacteria bacterium]|nr:hypothetical protein [Candidatus Coatesbacteria bacterium]
MCRAPAKRRRPVDIEIDFAPLMKDPDAATTISPEGSQRLRPSQGRGIDAMGRGALMLPYNWMWF